LTSCQIMRDPMKLSNHDNSLRNSKT
jgi:hypothetical protein